MNATKGTSSISRNGADLRGLRGHLDWSRLRRLSPLQRGFYEGYHGHSYLPGLNYTSSQAWLEFLDGWRRGQAELREKRRLRGELLL